MTKAVFPRVLIAGLAGDTGKSLVSLGLSVALRRKGLRIAPFKKGPDFIDAAWLGEAAGTAGRNLDTFLMPAEAILSSLRRASLCADVGIIEGNRGLFDGMDAEGSHSTALLARLTGTPVVLVVDVTKVTRTIAALVLGCRTLDPSLRLAGVLLNRVGTARQEAVIRDAVRVETGIPVLGAIPRLAIEHLPSRHLGLITPAEYPGVTETLEDAGAVLTFISPVSDSELPAIDVLYAGGGFPEEHAAALSDNVAFREALRKSIDEGLPVWAECGGPMYLAGALKSRGQSYPMVGALPVTVEQTARPQGHGYVQARVDGRNPFLPEQTAVRGHEFHYSRLRGDLAGLDTVLALSKGVGVGGGRDGICSRRVLASYTHLHALGMPGWADGLVRASEGGAA